MQILRRQTLLGITGVLASLALQNASAQNQESKDPPVPLDPSFPAVGELFTRLAPIDDAMKRILQEHSFPGATLAVAREGRLLLARGYGYADKENNRFAEPNDLFRIASISKPITAVAVLKLVEQGKLSLTDKIWSLLSLAEPKDARWKEITIRNLLDHSGGWDRDKSFDAMFKSVEFAKEENSPPPAGPNVVISAMLKRDLDFSPGERYAYSNFGYCLLGRAIEKVTGLPYEDYVRRTILNPIGASRMRIGATRFIAPGEVRYYDLDRTAPSVFAEDLGKKVYTPYDAWYLEAMDAHGGWIASALDLVRFGNALVNPSSAPVLSPASIDAMWAPSPGALGFTPQGARKEQYYALGWSVRHAPDDEIISHTGSLPGTSTLLLLHRRSKMVWAALFNTRAGSKNQLPSSVVYNQIAEWRKQITEWPIGDLFPHIS